MDLSGLTQRDTELVYALVEHLRAKNSGEGKSGFGRSFFAPHLSGGYPTT